MRAGTADVCTPEYDELHDAVLNAPPHDRTEEIRVLELGAGTVELASIWQYYNFAVYGGQKGD
ncbi:hypothetical protein [Halorussus ruber]|uniref:hypothetical protein n=1 Tax=Halorussus ruber TaxID=1126238 RepID=UPI001FE34ABF|nr:hypothetical protein [Halorussus ruber]